MLDRDQCRAASVSEGPVQPDRTAYRNLEPLSRETLDIASALEQLPVTERHRLLRIIRAFTGRATIRDDIPHSGSSLTSKTLERI